MTAPKKAPVDTNEAAPNVEPISAAQSIVGVMRAVSHVAKREENKDQKYSFRGIDAVVNAVGPALRTVGGFIVPTVKEIRYERGLTRNGGALLESYLTVQYAWHGTDGGAPIVSEVVAEAKDTSDKGTAKAMSVAYRTYLLQVLMLPTDDRDPDADSIEAAVPQPQQQPAQPIPSREEWLARVDAAESLDAAVKVWQQANVLVKQKRLEQSVLDELGVKCQERRDKDTQAKAGEPESTPEPPATEV